MIAEFGKLKEAVPSFAPENIMAGLEEAAVSAFKHISREAVSVHGCWFHFSQAVIKHAKKIGLTTPYRDGVGMRHRSRSSGMAGSLRTVNTFDARVRAGVDGRRRGALSELQKGYPQGSAVSRRHPQ